MKINHKTTFLDKSRVKKELEFSPLMREINPDKSFPLLEDPNETGRALIIGMFVLRSARREWQGPLTDKDGNQSIYDVEDWIYNLNTINGGGVIADSNLMDGFRLGMQYAVSDAVMVGSNTVANDGTPGPDGKRGYLWMPYECTEWPHLKEADSRMAQRFTELREHFRRQGYASDRTYPAQIAISRSGKAADPDVLSASMFHEANPDGSPMEAYILTSEDGARNIRERAGRYGLAYRIDDVLMVHSPGDKPGEIDLASLPQRLYSEYGMKLVNHDGGALVLDAFCRAGIIPQLNFTFARKPSLKEVVKTSPFIPEDHREEILAGFDDLILPMFSGQGGRIPKSMKVVQVIQDEDDEAAVVVLDARDVKGL